VFASRAKIGNANVCSSGRIYDPFREFSSAYMEAFAVKDCCSTIERTVVEAVWFPGLQRLIRWLAFREVRTTQEAVVLVQYKACWFISMTAHQFSDVLSRHVLVALDGSSLAALQFACKHLMGHSSCRLHIVTVTPASRHGATEGRWLLDGE
jgi:hypothetical protein